MRLVPLPDESGPLAEHPPFFAYCRERSCCELSKSEANLRLIVPARKHQPFNPETGQRCGPSSPPLFAALLAAILFTACQSPPLPDPSVSLQPLTTAELRDTLVSNALSRSGGPFWRQWDYAGVHRGNGTMTGRVSWSGGEEVATGVWEVLPRRPLLPHLGQRMGRGAARLLWGLARRRHPRLRSCQRVPWGCRPLRLSPAARQSPRSLTRLPAASSSHRPARDGQAEGVIEFTVGQIEISGAGG